MNRPRAKLQPTVSLGHLSPTGLGCLGPPPLMGAKPFAALAPLTYASWGCPGGVPFFLSFFLSVVATGECKVVVREGEESAKPWGGEGDGRGGGRDVLV